jgi:anaerobic nitric oxide reductase transcription regulator
VVLPGYFCEQCRFMGLAQVILLSDAGQAARLVVPGNVRTGACDHRAVVLARATQAGNDIAGAAAFSAAPWKRATLPTVSPQPMRKR